MASPDDLQACVFAAQGVFDPLKALIARNPAVVNAKNAVRARQRRSHLHPLVDGQPLERPASVLDTSARARPAWRGRAFWPEAAHALVIMRLCMCATNSACTRLVWPTRAERGVSADPGRLQPAPGDCGVLARAPCGRQPSHSGTESSKRTRRGAVAAHLSVPAFIPPV
jgi:hypothetical protein